MLTAPEGGDWGGVLLVAVCCEEDHDHIYAQLSILTVHSVPANQHSGQEASCGCIEVGKKRWLSGD